MMAIKKNLMKNSTQNQTPLDLKNFGLSPDFQISWGKAHQKRKSSISGCEWQLEVTGKG